MRRLSAVALFMVCVLTGCATTGKLAAPKLTLVAASMTSADVFSQQFKVKLHVDNPNARDLPIKSIAYTLFLEGDSFAEGRSNAPFVVPANGSKDFDLTVQTHFISSIGRLLSRIAGTSRTQVEYVFAGTVELDMRFTPKLKFSEAGVVDLAKR